MWQDVGCLNNPSCSPCPPGPATDMISGFVVLHHRGVTTTPPMVFSVHALLSAKNAAQPLLLNGLRFFFKVLTSMDNGGIIPHEVMINERHFCEKIECYHPF